MRVCLPEFQRDPSQERSEGALVSTAGSSGGASGALLWLLLPAVLGLPTMRCLPTSPASPEVHTTFDVGLKKESVYGKGRDRTFETCNVPLEPDSSTACEATSTFVNCRRNNTFWRCFPAG